MAFAVSVNVFSYALFLSVVASVEGFLVIHLHLRYQGLVTHKRVVAVVISICLLNVLFPYLAFWVSRDISFPIGLSAGGFCLLLPTLAYIKIYLAVQRLKNQILALQLQDAVESDETENFASII